MLQRSPGPNRHPPLFKKGLLWGTCLFASAAIFACSDDPTEQAPPAPETQSATSLAQLSWLEPTATTRPEIWLVSRMTKTAVDENDPALARTAMILEAASRQFREPQRMIANRAVQLEGMLAATQEAEQAIDLIDVLTNVSGANSNAEGFAAVCQHYYNLRSSGLTRDEALTDLKRRQGAAQ